MHIDIQIGTRLSSLSIDMLRPNKTLQEDGFAARMLAANEVEELQKQQELSMLNKDIEDNDDVDAFFLKFTKHMNSAVSRNVNTFIKVMNDEADKRVMSENVSAGPDKVDSEELLQMAEKFDAGLGDILSAGHTDKVSRSMTTAEIEYLNVKLEAADRQKELTPDSMVQNNNDFFAPTMETPALNKQENMLPETAPLQEQNC